MPIQPIQPLISEDMQDDCTATYHPIQTSQSLSTPTMLYQVKPRHSQINLPNTSAYLHQPEPIYTNQALLSQTQALSDQPTNTSAYLHQPEPIYTNQALPSQIQAISNQPNNTSAYPHQPGPINTSQVLSTPARSYQHQPSSTKSNPGTLRPTYQHISHFIKMFDILRMEFRYTSTNLLLHE